MVVAIAVTASIAFLVAHETAKVGASSGPVAVRKDVKDLTPAEQQAYVAAVLKAKATPDPAAPTHSLYDSFVLDHVLAFRCTNSWHQDGSWAGAAHHSPTFLPWHRELLARFEQMLRDVSGDETMTLPYWDWTDSVSTAAVFSADFMGGNGDPAQEWVVMDGPFRKGQWQITVQDPKPMLKGVADPNPYLVRRFGSFMGQPISLPTVGDVALALGVGSYDRAPFNAASSPAGSFRTALEGWSDPTPVVCEDGWLNQGHTAGSPHRLHNAVHIYTGGIWMDGGKMVEGTVVYNTAPNDPVFFLHHANIDRIFAAWEQIGSGSYLPTGGAPTGWNGSDTMWPWRDRTIDSWFGTVRNGYRYETLPVLG